jgi:hypothetical protein
VASTPLPELIQLAYSLGLMANPGLLSEVDTYTWRAEEAMLSTAQDHRKGQRGEQDHIWQATLDANAQVFTTHPREPVPMTTNWFTNSGYWTGDGAMPRSAQHERVNISIYDPLYEADNASPIEFQRYEPYTHAYFPTEHFDEVVESNGWVIGRKGDGYVALWSWRDTQWRVYDPNTEPTRGLTGPFDLLAPGGADNVWVTEVGRAADWPGADPFGEFVAAITAETPSVTPLAQGFDVAYDSPSAGAVSLGWDEPFTVAGATQSIDAYPRWSSPWSEVAWGELCYTATADGETLTLDFSALEPLIVDETAAPGEPVCLPDDAPVDGDPAGVPARTRAPSADPATPADDPARFTG